MPQIDPLQAIRKAHQDVRRLEQAQSARNRYVVTFAIILLIEFILLRLLGA